MLRRVPPFAVLLIALIGLPAAAQSKSGSAQFSFQPGQLVYVVAYRMSGEPDFYMEARVKQAFEKQKVFKTARKASESDFVFLLYSEYQTPRTTTIFSRPDPNQEYLISLTGFALTPAQYDLAKGNLDALREASQWHDQATMGRAYRIRKTSAGSWSRNSMMRLQAPQIRRSPRPRRLSARRRRIKPASRLPTMLKPLLSRKRLRRERRRAI